MILPFFLGGGAFNIFLLRQFFRTIPIELDEAAKIDGSSNLRIFWQILLPNLKPVLAVVVVFTAIFNWNSFMSPLVFINTTEKLPVAVGIQMVLAGSQAGPGKHRCDDGCFDIDHDSCHHVVCLLTEVLYAGDRSHRPERSVTSRSCPPGSLESTSGRTHG